ncbi:MAG: glutamate-1-semialdehyde 2,1-aminomutase [Candidatus Omnitrophica bacterium]|nr:glutamate-1-semialdehyde 2,1-aminomutase [Candidatus Omnitrophota bacterium]
MRDTVASGEWRVANSKARSLRTPNSELRTILEEAQRYLVGGVNSPVRAFRQVGGDPLLLVQARGAEVRDPGGRRWLDFIMGWGALLLGHNALPVVRAIQRGMKQGILMGLTHPAEVELARLIVEAVPSVEQVRFMVSGTEACMTAVRLARAQTGRTKIVVFEGCYHGHAASLMAGKTTSVASVSGSEVISVPFNDLGAFEMAIRRHGDDVACVIVESVAANMGVVVPEPGFLQRLRALTSRHGILLIFDEVVTGFRVGFGGAQGYVGVRPDLTTFGKIIGGGLPIGALGGPRQLMQRLAPEGDVFHGGTFAGHPLSMTAGIATLQELKTDPPYERLERLSGRLAEGLLKSASRSDIAIQINRLGSMLSVFFSETPVRDFAQAKASRRDRFAQWAQSLRRHGILIPPSPLEALFLSTAHTEAQVDRMVDASRTAFRSLKKKRFR